MLLLQANEAANATNALLQYGVLGIFSVLLIAALVGVFKLYTAQHEKQMQALQSQIEDLKKNLDAEKQSRVKLETEFHNYISNDNKAILTALVKSTEALESNNEILHQVKAKMV